MKNETIVFIIIALIVGAIIGANLFPKTNTTNQCGYERNDALLYFCSQINTDYNYVGLANADKQSFGLPSNWVGLGSFTCYIKNDTAQSLTTGNSYSFGIYPGDLS
jgi:hypothetical protein